MICLKILRFYQKFLSPLKPAACRYYPSCSEYALWQFQKKNFFLAFFSTFFRILRCNPFFKGGFDYPRVSKNFYLINLCFKPIFLAEKQLCFLYIPYKNKSFYLIKIIFKRTNQ
ncbi:membrane protein insertion efficiency factor YidD [Campylobacter jejuni]